MSVNRKFSASRRAFFRLRSEPETEVIRPPWTDETSVTNQCTSCNACIEACPESILRADADGHPMVVFDGGECTFCKKCVESCEAQVFDLSRARPWDLKVEIQTGCLQEQGISCQLCRDSCPQSAIRVNLDKRPFGRLKIDVDLCTGCGACLSTCPQEVLAITRVPQDTEAA